MIRHAGRMAREVAGFWPRPNPTRGARRRRSWWRRGRERTALAERRSLRTARRRRRRPTPARAGRRCVGPGQSATASKNGTNRPRCRARAPSERRTPPLCPHRAPQRHAARRLEHLGAAVGGDANTDAPGRSDGCGGTLAPALWLPCGRAGPAVHRPRARLADAGDGHAQLSKRSRSMGIELMSVAPHPRIRAGHAYALSQPIPVGCQMPIVRILSNRRPRVACPDPEAAGLI